MIERQSLIVGEWPRKPPRFGVPRAMFGVVAAGIITSVTLAAHATSAPRIKGDIDGDGKTDITVWRPSTGVWYWIDSSNGIGYMATYGQQGDVPLSGDYDGDGKTDIVVWRPSNGTFYLSLSATNTGEWATWGVEGDIPVAGDIDGDGKTDLVVYRPWNGSWWWVDSSTGGGWTVTFGQDGDVPAVGDYDGDGKADLAIWRPSNGTWYVSQSSNGVHTTTQWGQQGDIPVVGDYDGDGKSDFAVWRPSNGTWYWINSSTGNRYQMQWGQQNDLPVAGDYNGDGKTDYTVWRPSNATWYVVYGGSYTIGPQTAWGSGGTNGGGSGTDIPLPDVPTSSWSDLDVTYFGQQQSNWCWAASEEMVAGYSGVALTQCVLANTNTGRTDCCTNSTSASGACNQGGCFSLTSHGFTETDLWQLNCGGLTPTGNSPLTFTQLTNEFQWNRPVAFAWSWTKGGGHELDAIGAWVSSTGQQWVTVNDPAAGGVEDMTYTAWVSGTGYKHQRDTYNIVRKK